MEFQCAGNRALGAASVSIKRVSDYTASSSDHVSISEFTSGRA
jgi:hypothetical protein